MSTHTHDARPVVEQALEGSGQAPACEACQALHGDAQATRLALLPEGEPGEAVWEGVQARIAADAARSELRVVLGCTYCKDALQRADAVYCATCLAPHHADCFQEHGRCSTPGCGDTDVVRSSAGADPAGHRGAGTWHASRRGVFSSQERPWVQALVWGLIVLSLAGIVGQVYELVAPAPLQQQELTDAEESAKFEAQREELNELVRRRTEPRYVGGTPNAATVQAREADVRAVLEQLAALGGNNVILSPEVVGTVTTDLRGVHWLTAFFNIVNALGDFAVVEEGDDLLRVVPTDSIEQQLVTEVFDLTPLSTDDADALVASLRVLAGEGRVEGVLVSHLRDRRALVVHSTKPALRMLQRTIDDTLGTPEAAPPTDLPANAELRALELGDRSWDEVLDLLERLELDPDTTSWTVQGQLVVFGSPDKLDALQQALAAEPR